MFKFSGICKVLDLQVSAKGVCTSSCPKLTRRLIKEFSEGGIFYKNEPHTRDLGISYTSGKSRPKHISNQRVKKTINKHCKIKSIARFSRRARNLYKSSGFSSDTYGHQACGVTPTQLRMHESRALASTGIPAAGRCRTSALIFGFGKYGTVQARLIRDTFVSWFQFLLHAEKYDIELIQDIEGTWLKAVAKISTKAYPFNHVTGLMTNVIAILLSAKWNLDRLSVGMILKTQHGSLQGLK
jgi:hypothetical protein